MDVKNAVRDKANYANIVAWFSGLGDLNPEQMVLLADTVSEMSEEIFEHYKALSDILKGQLQRIRRICREQGCEQAFPEASARQQLAYALSKACAQQVVLEEKYEELKEALKK